MEKALSISRLNVTPQRRLLSVLEPAVKAIGKTAKFCRRVEQRAVDWFRRAEERGLEKQVRFVDRSQRQRRALLVLAGYKPELWPLVLPRIARHTPNNVDICLVCSKPSEANYHALEKAAAQYGWSVLRTSVNKLSLAQNCAIQSLPCAEIITKIDEDIFVTANYIERLEECLVKAEEERRYQVGLVAPLIPINGFSYIPLLRTLGLNGEFKKQFPDHPLMSVASGVGVHHDGLVAEWLWRHFSPIDSVAQKLANDPFQYSVCPHRFSIGTILFRRKFWSEMGRFSPEGSEGEVGADELKICRFCMDRSRAIVVSHNAFCAHFSFGPQTAHMLNVLRQHPALFQ